MKTILKVIFCAVVLSFISVSWADEHTYWVGGAGNWLDPAMWTNGVPDTVPPAEGGRCVGFSGSTSAAYLGPGETSEFGSASFWSDFWGPEWGATLNIDGGRMIHYGFAAAPIGAADAPSNIFVTNGGYLEVGELGLGDNWWFWDAPYVNLTVSDSTVKVRGWLWLGGQINLLGNSTLDIGGLVNMAAHGSTYAKINIEDNAEMLIRGTAEGRDVYQEILTWIANGQLVAFGGTGEVVVSQGPTGALITAVIPEPATVILLGLGGLTLLRKRI